MKPQAPQKVSRLAAGMLMEIMMGEVLEPTDRGVDRRLRVIRADDRVNAVLSHYLAAAREQAILRHHVGVEKQQGCAARQAGAGVACRGNAAARLQPEQADRKAARDCGGRVAGTVIDHDDFGFVSSLGAGRLQACRDRAGRIVSGDNHAQFWDGRDHPDSGSEA